MSQSQERQESERVCASYPLDVSVVELRTKDCDEPRYLFEAPDHVGKRFDDEESALLYADVYFDVNGFAEAGTGGRGIPPEIVQAGRDTLAAYFVTMPGVDAQWVASFYGHKPERAERYVSRVRKRASEIREGIADRR
ncbi:hypothetical protein [Halomicrobium katesii]|uniref:hypothetical protein n=1 Tax=Halomicrobium katesii TaxID=437163 RepID=UPI0003777D09|nr:hypothetical protein [Halomicrobium katesii]